MLGIELVKDRATKEPAKAECAQVLETCGEMGLLLGKGGLQGQTIRFAPPMCIHERTPISCSKSSIKPSQVCENRLVGEAVRFPRESLIRVLD